MDDTKRQLLIMGAFGIIAGGIYFAQTMEAPAEGDPNAEVASAEQSSDEPQEPEAAAASADDEVDYAARAAAERVVSIETGEFNATFSNLNTGMLSFELKDPRFQTDTGAPLDLVTTDREQFYNFRVSLPGLPIPADAVWEPEQVDVDTVRFRWSGHGIRVMREITAGSGAYQLWSTVQVANESDSERTYRVVHHTTHYVSREAEEGGFIGRPSTAASFGLCNYGDDEMERVTTEDMVERESGFGGNVVFAGIADAYFATAVASGSGGTRAERCVLRASRRGGTIADETWSGSLVEVDLKDPTVTVPAGESNIMNAIAFMGPSDRDALRTAGHGLPQVVDLGWFSFIANSLSDLLEKIHDVVGNWGLAIILLTILVKLVFFPLTMKSFGAMAKMRKLKPQIDALNEKYAEDKEKKGAAMMELYRREKINPAAGCLPSLLQMPVWFALYRSLSTNIELYHAPFTLYWSDLSAPDPYYVLPGCVAILMHLQQRLTPTTMDATQAKMMMYFMPIMIGGFMLFLPAGLCLYMVTNSTLTILQQRVIYARLDREEAAAKDAPMPFQTDGSNDDDEPEPEPDARMEASSASATRVARKGSRKKRQRRG